MKADLLTLVRLRAMVLQAPQAVHEWYNIQTWGDHLPYMDVELQHSTMLIFLQASSPRLARG